MLTQGKQRALTLSEISRLREACGSLDARRAELCDAMIVVLYNTGLRFQELIWLRAGSIDRHGYARSAKTGAKVYLNAPARAAIGRLPSDRVDLIPVGRLMFDPAWRLIVAKAGLPPETRPHALRRNFASAAVNAVIDNALSLSYAESANGVPGEPYTRARLDALPQPAEPTWRTKGGER